MFSVLSFNILKHTLSKKDNIRVKYNIDKNILFCVAYMFSLKLVCLYLRNTVFLIILYVFMTLNVIWLKQLCEFKNA